MQERQRNKNEKLRVLRLISACVESNVRVKASFHAGLWHIAVLSGTIFRVYHEYLDLGRQHLFLLFLCRP